MEPQEALSNVETAKPVTCVFGLMGIGSIGTTEGTGLVFL